ncbi:MAG: hypothetical protein AAB340_00450 [Patescibacteria group bacterium]
MDFLESFSRYHKVILICIILALLSLIDKDLAVGAIFVVFLSSIALFFINTINPVRKGNILTNNSPFLEKEKKEAELSNWVKEKPARNASPARHNNAGNAGWHSDAGGETVKFLTLLFLIVFLIHIVMVVFVYYADFQPFSEGRGDFNEYHAIALEISKRVSAGNFSLEGLPFLGLPLVHYYPLAIGYVYLLTVPSMLMGQLLNAWIVALIAVFVFLLVCQIGRSKKEGFIVGLIVCFYPSLAFYGSLLLKDALVVLLSVIGLLLTLKIIKKFSWLNFLIFYIVLAGVTHFRFYIGYALILSFIICWFSFCDLRIKKRVIYGIIMILLLGFLPRIAPLDGATQGYMGVKAIKNFLNPQTIVGYRELAYPPKSQLQETKKAEETIPLPEGKSTIAQDSSIVIDAGFDNPISFLKSNSLSFVYSILGPFPWQLKKAKHLFVLPEVIPWYFLLFFIIKGMLKSIKVNYKVILPLIIFSLLIFGVLSLYINNFGMITRIRMPAFLALLCLLPFGLDRLKNVKVPLLEKYLKL